MKYPKSPYDTEGGLVHFPRMLDKIRLNKKEGLPKDYRRRMGKGLDGFVCRFLGVSHADVAAQVEAGATDAEVLAWCFENGRKPGEEETMQFSKFLIKLGWRDEDIGMDERLRDYKEDAGLAHRDDIQTIFDFIEVDEGRKT